MTRFWLVRHGSTDTLEREIAGRKQGVELNARGRAEAAALAARLADERFAAVYASPLERTQATARVIAQPLGCKVIVCEGLSELQFGEWTGRSFPELDHDPRFARWNQFRSATRIPGGETMLEVQARALSALLELRERHRDERVLVVSHGDVIRALIACALGMPLDFFGRLEIAPASISELELDEGWTRVHRLNDLAHLVV